MSKSTPPPMPDFPPPPPPATKRNRTNVIIIGSAAAVIATIIATGVVVANSRDDNSSDTTTAAETSTPSDDTITAAAEPEPTPEDTEPEVMGLTDGVTYEDGVEVDLSGYKRGVSSAYAAPESTPYISFKVKIVNGSESVVDIGTGYVMCYYGDESREAEQIFDEGLDGLPSMQLRPGRTATTRVACEMPKSEEYLQIELAPSMEAETAIFAGNVK
ncbi:hypothetical protein [Streptomyces sp. NPDC007264]|uniref:hypothetical protein n=1 Tax=Streptomyces sp. NPDC007264 TaxID=3364777 RepID=UPI0036DCA959